MVECGAWDVRIGGVCVICMCLARGSVGGEGVEWLSG